MAARSTRKRSGVLDRVHLHRVRVKGWPGGSEGQFPAVRLHRRARCRRRRRPSSEGEKTERTSCTSRSRWARWCRRTTCRRLKKRLRFSPGPLLAANLLLGDDHQVERRPDAQRRTTRPNRCRTRRMVVVHRSESERQHLRCGCRLPAVRRRRRFKEAVKGGVPANKFEWVNEQTKPKTLGGAKNEGVAKAVNDTRGAPSGMWRLGYAQDQNIPYAHWFRTRRRATGWTPRPPRR